MENNNYANDLGEVPAYNLEITLERWGKKFSFDILSSPDECYNDEKLKTLPGFLR